MKTALIKNTIREIKSSLGRFISIALMISLGTFAYVGLKSAGPDMRYTLDELTAETNMSHMVVQFTTDIEEKDKEKILEYKEIADFEFLKTIELKTKEDDKLINLIELPERISKPKVLEGRYPEKQGELLIDNGLRSEISIGDKLIFKKEEESLKFILDDTTINGTNEKDKDKVKEVDKNKEKDKEKETKEPRLQTYEYEVVGFCITPEYLGQFDKGRSFSRYGDFYSFAYISKSNFNNIKDIKENNKTQIAYLRFENIQNMKTLDLGFEKRSIRHKEYLEKVFANRPKELFNEMNDNILDELAIKEKEIFDAKKELKNAENEIVKGKIKILEGWQEYKDGLEEYNKEIKDAESELSKARKLVDDGVAKYNEGKSEFDAAKTKYQEGLQQYNTGLARYNQSKTKLDEGETALNLLKQNKDKLLALKSLVANEVTLKKIIDKYNSLVAERTIKEKQRDEAIAAGNTDLAAQLQLEIDAINTQIAALGDIGAINIQYNSIQAAKASFDDYQRGIYSLEYNAIFKGSPSYIQGLIDSIPSKESEIAQGKVELKASKVLLDNAKKELDVAKVEIDQGQIVLNKSKKELDNAKLELRSAESIFNTEKSKSSALLQNSREELLQAEKDLSEAETKFKKEKSKATKEIEDAEKKIEKVKTDIKKLDKPLCIFHTRYDNTNYYLFYDSAGRIDILANVFPPFLFLIALLVSLTTMTRMVDEQRQEIGTYKGLGYLNNEIALKYAVYGGIAAIIGGLIGVAIGSSILSEVTFNAYATTFVIKQRLHVMNYAGGIFSMILAIACTSLAAYLSVKKYLNKNAAILMRPRVQKTGKKTFFEKIKFVWKRLPFLTKVTLRNVFRYKGRMLMTIIGVGGCTGLLLFGFALRYSMAETLPRQRENIIRSDFIVSYNEIIDEEDAKKFKEFIAKDDRIEKSNSLHSEPIQYKDSKGQIANILLMVPKDIEGFNEQISLIDSRSDSEQIKAIPKYNKELREREKNRLIALRKQDKQDIINLDNNSAVFSDKLLNVTGKETGENIFIQDLYGKEYKVKVGRPITNYISHFAYMSPEYYDKIFDKATEPNSYLIKLKPEVDVAKFKADMLEFVVTTSSLDMSFAEINNWVSSIDAVVILITVISGILAFVVLYNLTYINISERLREISTIKVLGFYPNEVTKYIYSETAILTVLGILFGYYIGHGLHDLIIDFIVPDMLNLYRGVTPLVYVGATLITVVFFVVVGIIIHKKLSKIDMIEALKGFE